MKVWLREAEQMSIWSSVVGADDAPNGPAEVLDLDVADADQYKGTSPVKVEAHVAIAPSWHGIIRLAIDGDDRWVTLGLDDVAAGRLAAQLETARAELRRRGSAA